jgi:hypothetical protein
LRVPRAAVEAIANVAVIDVALATFVPDTVTSAPAEIVAPATKLEPVSVTGTELPGFPELGLIVVRIGVVGPTTVNGWGPLVPAVVVTVTFEGPSGAVPVMVNVAVIEVLLTTVTLLTVTPVPLTATVAPAAKFVPERVSFTAVP